MSARDLAPTFAIAGRRIGGGAPCYVIAEAGSNHNRDLGLARELIDVAADAGADAVKFQIYSGKTLYSSKTPRFTYLEGVADKDTQQLLEDIETPREWLPDLAEHAQKAGIAFFAAPFDDAAVQELADVGVPAYKVANYELIDVHLIRRVAEAGVPVILSVGMATYGEVEDALDAAVAGGATEIALLRCAAQYPAPANIMNLRAMGTMRAAFGVPVGLSDHSEGIHVPLGATGLGMDLLEKHFTLDRSMPGPDHPFAIEPDELRALVRGVREVESAMGNGRLEGPTAEEAEMHRLARRSVIAARPIQAGTAIRREDLTIKRPGFGIAPKELDHVVGRVARVDIEFDDIITWDMV
ncbi:MAG TPA: N-acetylneuraminate synthase family protein [Baekduia sp.]|uniref:N-acetylneuraminate synthase family protein n=1 Tax=Baekduia sp. TaxID=2600305 RepID=UPI002CF9CF9B|nr:N-acetylneuraminate synthase family protein [Baekduia sp.]HMJ36446.1 N-acetylneuraminate synthase family protein [Baekduia sp.]